MATHIFISRSKVPPGRWREAFPDAQIGETLPANVSSEAVVWLHNLDPKKFSAALPAGVRIVVLDDKPSDEKGLAVLSGGAVGYANAHAAPSVLQAIESVVSNQGLWVGESLLSRLLRSLSNMPVPAQSPESKPLLGSLSEREREVALMVSRGESNKEIARDLNVTERTVKAHLSACFEKLGVRDRLQLALMLKAAT